jgi:hypothetical protein
MSSQFDIPESGQVVELLSSNQGVTIVNIGTEIVDICPTLDMNPSTTIPLTAGASLPWPPTYNTAFAQIDTELQTPDADGSVYVLIGVLPYTAPTTVNNILAGEVQIEGPIPLPVAISEDPLPVLEAAGLSYATQVVAANATAELLGAAAPGLTHRIVYADCDSIKNSYTLGSGGVGPDDVYPAGLQQPFLSLGGTIPILHFTLQRPSLWLGGFCTTDSLTITGGANPDGNSVRATVFYDDIPTPAIP